ncbi:MAG: D-alanyl-D-alanine carboxypeptidase family protein [Alphaproteobacteria bacterium]|nr:D-alanyl-D-alanine carboxypeptidase family protein [Alphaproteobacteria bacterium]
MPQRIVSHLRLRPSSALFATVAALLLALVLAIAPARGQSLETSAKQALLLDFDTGAVLLDKAADEKMYPSSMTKMMTVYVLMQRIKEGVLAMDDLLPVSEKAWRKGGSKMFVEVGKQVSVEDLLYGIIIQSGNDATIVVAEAISGSEEAFAVEMTRVAREIGMTGTQFKNASGWPDPEHYTTARDLAVLAIRKIRDFPEMYKLYAETEFTFNGITQSNRNPLLYRNVGADGLKTGHTEAAGYGLTASAVRDGRRLIMVVNGLESRRARAEESEKLINWGFREWSSYALFEAGDTVTEAQVWLGESGATPLIVQQDVAVTIRRRARDDLKVVVRFDEPLPAPIAAGQTVGALIVTAPGIEPIQAPLIAPAAVQQLGPTGRLNAALNYLIWGESR